MFKEKIPIIGSLYKKNKKLCETVAQMKNQIEQQNKLLDSHVYYSSLGEDIILKNIFFDYFRGYVTEKGFYIDVGAYHPRCASNTKILYDRGWRGINIEANPYAVNRFNKFRPHDINLNYAVSGEMGEIDFYLFGDEQSEFYGSSSTIDINFKNYVEKTQNVVAKTLKVPSNTLKFIMQNYVKNKRIDFMNIDIECGELEALKSNDFSLYRPRVIAVEILSKTGSVENELKNNSVIQYLKSENYKLFSITLLTYFFYDTLSESKAQIETWLDFSDD